jgi:hypothetical protein
LTVDRGESLTRFPSEKSLISPEVNAVRRLPDTRVIGYCAVFKVREEAKLTACKPRTKSRELPAASRSLKTQQHASKSLTRIGLGEMCLIETMLPSLRAHFSRP